METTTLLLIGAGILGALLAVMLLIKIIKGILQMGYLLLVLGSSAFLAYYVGTPEGSTLLPQTVNVDVRLIQAGIVIIMPLVLSLLVAILIFIVRSIFKSGSKKRVTDTNPTPVMPFHPPSQAELDRMQRVQQNPYAQQNPQYPPQNPQYPPTQPPQYPPQQNQPYYPPSAPTVQNMPPVDPTRRTPPAEPTRPNPIVRDNDER
jgi:hypothetical protein